MVWSNVKIHNAVATSAALGFPIAAAGTIGYVRPGTVRPGCQESTFGFVYAPGVDRDRRSGCPTAPFGARWRTRSTRSL